MVPISTRPASRRHLGDVGGQNQPPKPGAVADQADTSSPLPPQGRRHARFPWRQVDAAQQPGPGAILDAGRGQPRRNFTHGESARSPWSRPRDRPGEGRRLQFRNHPHRKAYRPTTRLSSAIPAADGPARASSASCDMPAGGPRQESVTPRPASRWRPVFAASGRDAVRGSGSTATDLDSVAAVPVPQAGATVNCTAVGEDPERAELRYAGKPPRIAA